MKWIFYFENEGVGGENSFVIEAPDHLIAFDEAYESFGPQVEDMFYEQIKENL